MQSTKNLGELCTLLIDDNYGELPSRIFAALLNKGRSAIPQLLQHTSLTPRQVRHGLVVLLQNNLLYFQVESGHTIYTANPDAAYNLVRAGKVLDIVGTAYGEREKEVMQNLLSMGHIQVEHLRDAYEAKFKQAALLSTASNGHSNGAADGDKEDDDPFADPDEPKPSKADNKTGLHIKSLQELDEVLACMIQAELVCCVTESSFRSWDDTRKLEEDTIRARDFSGGVRGGKGKEDFDSRVSKRLREVRDEPLSLKDKVQVKAQLNKRRKMTGWSSVNPVRDDSGLIIDGNVVLRVNYEKCAVGIRNQQLVHAVSEVYGDTTAAVYSALLQQLTKKISRCRLDPKLDGNGADDGFGDLDIKVSTHEVFDRIEPTLDLSAGIGKVKTQQMDRKNANKIRDQRPGTKPMYEEAEELVGDASSDEDEDMEEANGHDFDDEGGDHATNGVNGNKVKFDTHNAPQKLTRREYFRQHLLLLCEGDDPFLRHCAMEAWTVDFESLMRALQVAELDTTIQRTVGRTGLRLVRILRRVGKMDEKTLPNLALMPKLDVQSLMLKMQMLGYADIQEVPRDNNRTASRTLFLYWTDTDRCIDRLLESTYKTMVRCMQRLNVERQKEADILDLVKRDDVRGREEQMIEPRHYKRFVKVMDIQEKLVAHLMRLDNMVGTFRDF
ncbi:unnamed protein product [Discula destructiva]